MAQDYFWADKHRDISQPADFNRARSPGNFLGVQVSNLEEVAVRLAHLRLALSPGIAYDAGLAVLLNCSQFEMAKTRQDSSGEKQGLEQIQKKTRTSHTVETD